MRGVRVGLLCILFVLAIGLASATITVNSASGSAGTPGYRAATDTILINLTTSSQDLSINGEPADCACKNSTFGRFDCSCVLEDTIATPSAGYTFTSTLGDTATASLLVDNTIGDVDNFYLNANNGSVILSYTMRDTGFNGASSCSGIRRIAVLEGTNTLQELSVNGSSTLCTVTGSSVLLLTSSGKKQIRLEVSDAVGNKKTTSLKNITVDVDTPEIKDIELRLPNSEQTLQTVANNVDVPIDITFVVEDIGLQSVSLDISSLNQNMLVKNTYKNIPVPVSSCIQNTTTDAESSTRYACALRNRILNINTNEINITITAIDNAGNRRVETIKKSLNVDNTKPHARLLTQHCDSTGRCYVKDGINKIIIQLDKIAFNNKLVYFDVNGNKGRVYNCSGNVCEGLSNIACTSGQMIDASIIASAPFISQDDYGNKLEPYFTQFYCDDSPPRIVNITPVGKYQLFTGDLIVSGGQLTINAEIYEREADELNATLFFDTVKNATEKATSCSKVNETHINCTWNAVGINEGSYVADLRMDVTDPIGNTVSKNYRLRVLGLKSDNETPNSMKIQFEKVIPASVNRIALDLASLNQLDYFVYAQYRITPRQANAKLLYQTIDVGNCIVQSNDDETSFNGREVFSSVKINNQRAKINDVNRIDFTFEKNIDVNALSNSFTVYCNVSAYVQEGSFVYKKPQSLVLEVPFIMRNSKLGTPGEALARKIRKAEEGTLVRAQFLSTADKLLGTLQTLCGFRRYVEAGELVGNVLSIAGETASLAVPVGGQAGPNQGMSLFLNAKSIGDCFYRPDYNGYLTDDEKSKLTEQQKQNLGIDRQNNLLLQNDESGFNTAQSSGRSCSNMLRTICDFTSCNIAERWADQQKDTSGNPSMLGAPSFELLGEGSNTDILQNYDIPDVSNSIISAVRLQCWPAVVHNLNKYRQTQCNYLFCLKNSAYSGTDISACDKAESIQICTLVVGEFFEVVGPARWAKNVAGNVNYIANNIGPLAATTLAKNTICSEYTSYFDFQKGQYNFQNKELQKKVTDLPRWKIYACQIPFQLARFVDGQSRASRSELYSYQPVPDMCEAAQCVGQPSCKLQDDFWSRISRLNNKYSLSPPQNQLQFKSQDQINQQAQASQHTKDLIKFRDRVSSAKIDDKGFTDSTEPTIQTEWSRLSAAGLSDVNSYPSAAPKSLDANGELAYRQDAIQRINRAIDIQEKNRLSNPAMSAPTSDRLDQLRQNPRFVIYSNTNNVNRLDRVKTLNEQIIEYESRRFSLDGGQFVTLSETERTQLASLKQQREYLLRNGGICTNDAACDAYRPEKDIDTAKSGTRTSVEKQMKTTNERINKDIDAEKKKLQDEIKLAKTVQEANTFGNTVFFVYQILYYNHMLDWMTSDYWFGEWFGTVLKLTDSSRWAESICNPDSALHLELAAESGDDSFVSCANGLCQAVLSFAAERTEQTLPNGTIKYLYTVVYYLGPVPPPQVKQDDLIEFNLHFYGPSGATAYGYRSDIQLQYNEIRKIQKSFQHAKLFNEICIDFDKEFPPLTSGAKKHFCRDIKENAFNTGNPSIDKDLYNPNPNQPFNIQTRGSENQPGVLE